MLVHPKLLGSFEVMDWRPSHSGVSLGEGRDTTLNRRVTLVQLERGATDSARDEFLTAARRLAGGRHRSLATVLEVVEDGDTPYMVLESASGGTLRQWLAFFPPSQRETLRLAGEIADGLLAARSLQITTVDLNLDSVWVDRAESSGSVAQPKVRLLQFRPLESVEPVGNDSDLLKSLGRLLFAMLSGGREAGSKKHPPLRSIAPCVSNGVARLVEQLLGGRRGWTLESVARRIAQLEREDHRRPLVWLAAGVLLGIAIAYPLFSKLETREGPFRPRVQLGLAAGMSEVAAPKVAAEASTTDDAEVQPVSLPPLNTTTDFEPLSPGWSDFVVSLPPQLQIQAVAVELRRRNPGFDGQVYEVEVQEEHVRRLRIDSDHVRDVTPVAALAHLEGIDLSGKSFRSGRLESFRSLRGLKLREIRAGWTRVRDLSPLAGMPLKVLHVGGTRVEDLAPLKGLPLENLEFWSTTVRDLTPLRELPQLKFLRLEGTLATDLAPLADLPLMRLSCNGLDVKDWSPLGKLPLQQINIDLETADQRVVLQGIKSLKMINGTPVEEVLRMSGK